MPIALSDEQVELTRAVDGLAARYAPPDQTRAQFAALPFGKRPPVWDALVSSGFPVVHVAEAFGGQGGDLVDAACVLDASGYRLVPGPLLPTMTAAAVLTLDAAGSPAAANALRAIVAGAPACVALPQDGTVRAVEINGTWRLTGDSAAVLGLCSAEQILIGANTDRGQRWFVLPAADVTGIVAAEPTDLTRDVGSVELDALAVPADRVVGEIDAERARCITVAMAAAEAVGIARWCVKTVTEHLKIREQFGRPIGAFQGLQHRAASLLVNAEVATAAAWDAARSATQSREQQWLATAAAAITVTGRIADFAMEALMMFGATGYTWEHDLHLYWRRAITLGAIGGCPDEWSTRLGASTESRDFTVELPDADPAFRRRIAELLDRAAELHDDPATVVASRPSLARGARRSYLGDVGLVAPHLKSPWGVGASAVEQLVIGEEFAHRDMPRPSLGIASWILPTLISFGSDAQLARFAATTLRGEITWCQLFSEPGAGSDLASLATRATKVDGGWRIQGQKVWTSYAHEAQWGALLARTDPDASKHGGISYFLLDMSSPGVDIRPLEQATGRPEFNEVFLDGVFIPDDMLVGEPGAGWQLAVETMANERMVIGNIKVDREKVLRELVDAAGTGAAHARAALGRARAGSNAIAALGVRDILRRLDGGAPGPESSVAKVATNVLLRRIASDSLALSGRSALTGGMDTPAVALTLEAPTELIGGGTLEIQLNIIATAIMGLPRK